MYHLGPLCLSGELLSLASSVCVVLAAHFSDSPASPENERSSFSAVLAKLGGEYPLGLAHLSAGEVCGVSDLSPKLQALGGLVREDEEHAARCAFVPVTLAVFCDFRSFIVISKHLEKANP